MHEVDLELFEAGTWNGWTFTPADIDRLIANAEKVEAYIKPRLILGHTKRSDQPEVGRMEQPCIGQLKRGSLRRVGDKLRGTFTSVPDVAKKAMAENLYPPTSVSIEAYPQFRETADLTHDNRGAYWEAGFAEGAGRPVIYTCKKGHIPAVHFDRNHHLIVEWDPDDLPKTAARLKATIRATMPAEAKLTDD
jgi:hypothetical protein